MKISLKKTSPTLKLLSTTTTTTTTTTSTTEVCLTWANMVQIPELKKKTSQSFVGSMGIMTSPEPKMASVAPFWAPEMKLCWSKLDLADNYGDRKKPFRKDLMSLIFWWCSNMYLYIYIWVLNWNQKSKTMLNHMYFFFEFALLPLPGVK